MGNTRHRIEAGAPSPFGEVKLLYVSTSKYEGDWQSILHSHPFSELFYVVKGKGSFVAGSREFSIAENDLVVINPHIEHTEKSDSSSPLEYIVLGIEGLSFLFDGSSSLSRKGDEKEGEIAKNNAVHKYSVTSSNIYAYLNIMLEEISRKQPNYETVCQNLLEVFLICILRNESLSVSQNTNSILSRDCAQIKDYLDSNYAQNITLGSLAAITHMNKYYMAHAFTKYTGMSPISYLMQKRIQEGKSLLESTSYSIAEISAMLGFSSQSYFSQAFKKAAGITPIQYRISFRKKNALEKPEE